jgi:hypothetical protein
LTNAFEVRHRYSDKAAKAQDKEALIASAQVKGKTAAGQCC